jgi:DNA-binding transcriptional LysR family regulator
MRYDLTDLRLLVAVADAGGIAAAARRVHLSTSALSERLKAMEEEAGVVLFARGVRGTNATAAGVAVIRQAREVLIQVEQLNGLVKTWRGRNQSELILMANSNAISSFMPDALAEFLISNPEVTVSVREALSDEIGIAVRAGDADIGIASGTADLSGLTLMPFRRDRLVLLVAHGHPLSSRERVAFEDTLDEPFVGLDEKAAIQLYLVGHAAMRGRTLNMRASLRSFDGVMRLVAVGAGIAILPESIVTRGGHAASATVIKLTNTWAERDLIVCLPADRQPAVMAETLAAHLVKNRAIT